MTKRLSPERIAMHRGALERATTDFDSNDWIRRELLGHIEAIEAELQRWKDQANAKVEAQKKELADAKAEIARLKARHDHALRLLTANSIEWLEKNG